MDADFESTASSGHARRAMALIAISLVVMALSGILYLHPTLPSQGVSASIAPPTQSTYRLRAVDFVNPRVGWVVGQLSAGELVLLHTADGGATWVRQLAVAGDVHPSYVKFFDARVGIFALVGVRPLLYRTGDGGATWEQRPALEEGASVTSWSFVDSDRGWMLARDARAPAAAPAGLYRTEDGGESWEDLGSPVPPPAQAYQVHFSYLTTGWLTTSGPAPVAYKTIDFGDTWQPVALPGPPGGWPAQGQFFVGVQPTAGTGAVASVVYFPPLKGRTGIGGTIRSFPPLIVRSFDGGRPRTDTYATLLDRLMPGGRTGASAPNERNLSTVDNGSSWDWFEPPFSGGAISYSGPADVWWVGANSWARSPDGGITWERVSGGAAVVEPLPGLLQVLDPTHAWLGGVAGQRPVLQRTDDAGRHWRTVALPPVATSIP